MNVLVSHDHGTNRKLLHAIFPTKGLRGCHAAEGVEALARMERDALNAIIPKSPMSNMGAYRLRSNIDRGRKKMNTGPPVAAFRKSGIRLVGDINRCHLSSVEPASASPRPNAEPGDGTRIVDILLVEDNADDAALALQAFKEARLTNRVQVVGDGAEALDFLFCRGAYAGRHVEEHPQVVLLDLHLPKIHGFEVLRQIKNDERTRMIPVVVLTASQKDRDVREARRLGAETYLVKPVDFHTFSRVTPQLQFDWALLTPSERATL